MNEIFFKEMKRIRQEMDDAYSMFLSTPKLMPKIVPGKGIELFQNPISDVVKRDVLVRAEMPGLKILELSGDNNQEIKSFRQERTEHGFQRSLQLPTQAKVDNANAKYENGILTVTLPKEHPELKKMGYKIK